MINVTNKTNCCGCNVCGDSCPKDAISFSIDNEGFWYPVVDTNKCIDCGICEQVCPIINISKFKKNDISQPECHIAQHKNLQSLFDSTSGSAFAAFAEKIYKDGGYVGGAIFNEDFSVRQLISSDKADLDRLRNSKYVQSNSSGFYTSVKECLNTGKQVLVCGLPCQMAALRSFLNKDYDNLIIVDVICLGINSPKILKGYIDYLENKYQSKVVYYKAKNKELGWKNLTTKVIFENGKVLYDTKDTCYFTHGFISTHLFSRPSCYDCKFKGFPRIADITIGDAWGIKIDKEMYDNLGVSLVLLNSSKGKVFYETMKRVLKEKEITYESIFANNQALLKSLPKPMVDRVEFYNDLTTMPFEKVAKKYIQLPSAMNLSTKNKLRNIVIFIYRICVGSGFSLRTWCQNIYYNFLAKPFKTQISEGKYIIVNKHCVLAISKSATIQLDGVMYLGYKRIKGSSLETRLLVENNAKLICNGNFSIGYGSDIELFANSIMTVGKGTHINMGATIICADSIILEDNVAIGRNVTIRDNNGKHYISRRIYKADRPIVIGQHTWLSEHVVVMPGTKTGTGVIAAACSTLRGKYPSFTIVSGNPAVVVDEDVYWKE